VTSATEMPPVVRGEIRPLTGLRIVAALWVVCFHFSFTPGDAYTAVWAPLRPLVSSGALGVDLFYVLSGFVITLTYVDKLGPRPSVRGAVGFWWARVCRIWPVYATVTTLFGGWILFKASRTPGGLHGGFLVWQTRQPEVDVWHWLEQLAMVQLWHRSDFAGSSWVGPAWSISAEWAAYVVFPLVVLVLFRLRRLPVAVTGVLAVACMVPFAYQSYRTGNPYYSWSWATRVGLGFLAGSFTFLTVRQVRITPRVERYAGGLAILACVELVTGLWWGWWRGQGQNEYGGVVVVAFPVLVGSLALSSRGLSRVLASGPMVHGGRISFSLYLVHVPIFEIFWTFMGWHPRIGPNSGLGELLVPQLLLCALLVAHLAYRFVEEPSRLWLRGRGPGSWSRRPAGERGGRGALRGHPRADGDAASGHRPGSAGPLTPAGEARPGVAPAATLPGHPGKL
jgi:peptidoglycan/LPS O-acetylase OafA/YrhL